MRRSLLGPILGLALSALSAAPGVARANFDWAGHVELDAEGLTSRDVTKRLDAVNALAKYDIALTQPYLLRAVTDADDRVRVPAARALGLGAARAVVPVMIDWLTDPDTKIKQAAADVLGDVGGPEATAGLVRSLGDSDAAVRIHAVKALGQIGRRGDASVVLALIPRLEDDKTDVRIATIAQLEELGDRRAVIPLVARFGDTPEARRAAVRAVGRLGDASAVPALIRLMGDANEDVRAAAVGALGTLGAVDAIDALTEQLGTGSETSRQKVAYALGQIAAVPRAGKAGEDAMRTLVQNLEATTTRAAAREALRVAGKAAVPALVAHLQGRLHGDPATAVTLLIDAGDPRATATLAAELERGRVATALVLRALGATRDPQALVPVLGALNSKDASIRLAAMEALRPLLGADARASDVLVDHLDDADLEIRVLAAEYLGALGAGAAGPKLTALLAPTTPLRLRHAAIDAVGEIGRTGKLPAATAPAALTALIGALREGPSELHASAATSLAYIGSPAALRELQALAKTTRGATQAEVVRAIGATLRGHGDASAQALLRTLTDDGDVRVALAAIAGLAAANALDAAPALRTMVEQASADRRRAAAWALGELHDAGAVSVLATAMASADDRLAGDAAWALGELVASDAALRAPARLGPLLDRWLHAVQFGGWAASTNAAASVARALWATKAAERAALLPKPRRDALAARMFHKSRLVRINLAHALAALGDADATKQLAQQLADDLSPRARAAAASALRRVPSTPPVAVALKRAGEDADASVRAAASAELAALPARSEWRTFYVVDPSADDARVRQEPYFVATDDALIWASYTDARGELTTEHVPASTTRDDVHPANHEAEY